MGRERESVCVNLVVGEEGEAVENEVKRVLGWVGLGWEVREMRME